jgi:hypothetical protein
MKSFIYIYIHIFYLSDTTAETSLNTNTVRKTNALPVITSNIEWGLEVQASCLTRRLTNYWSIIIDCNLAFSEITTHRN